MDYTSALKTLNGRTSRKVMHNTYLQTRGDDIALKYHNTDVLLFKPNGDTVLDCDGWHTSTTKLRLNEYLPHGYRIWQQSGVWYMSKHVFAEGTITHVVKDGMVIHADGSVDGAGIDAAREQRALKRRIRKYAADYITALKDGKVPAPSGGDCWCCLIFDKDEANASKDTSHLISHMDERYYVPTIAARALDAFGGSQVERMALAAMWDETNTKALKVKAEIMNKMHNGNSFLNIGFEQLQKHIYRYICRKFGFAN